METLAHVNRSMLEKLYTDNLPNIERMLAEMLKRVQTCLDAEGLAPTYKQRIKSFPSYFNKRIKFIRDAAGTEAKPLPVTDIIAIRIVCPFIGDLEKVENALQNTFSVREVERKGAQHSFKEFGYESTHILLNIPHDVLNGNTFLDPPVCEIQVRTILQDAWAEVEHELVYKAEFTPFDDPMKRKLAALNANLTLSDMLFQEIRDYQHQLNNELAKRRVAFLKKIEDSIDGDLYKNYKEKSALHRDDQRQPSWLAGFKSIDDLLLEALNAHNRADYINAISIYTHILELKPKPELCALLYKHRGMAYFSESRYEESMDDFSAALALDPKDYKAAYYRGVVHSVKQNYGTAIDDFNEALSLHPYHFYSTYRRAQAYYHIGDYPKALADCEAAVELEPANESLQKLRAMVHEKLKL